MKRLSNSVRFFAAYALMLLIAVRVGVYAYYHKTEKYSVDVSSNLDDCMQDAIKTYEQTKNNPSNEITNLVGTARYVLARQLKSCLNDFDDPANY